MTPTVQLVRLPCYVDLPLPEYQTAGAAGFDLRAALIGAGLEVCLWGDVTLRLDQGTPVLRMGPHSRALVPLGLVAVIPQGFEGQIRPRSGLAKSHGVTIPNAPGTIDADYRGELKVILQTGAQGFVIRNGERVAQMIIAPVVRAVLVEVPPEEAPQTVRGAGGFGSSGVV